MLNFGLLAGWLMALLVFIGGCVPPPEEGAKGFDWTIIIFLVLIFGVFYFLILRPQRRRQKQHNELMQELKKGDKVITTGGIYGVIDNISDESVVLKIESGATIRVARNSLVGRRQEK